MVMKDHNKRLYKHGDFETPSNHSKILNTKVDHIKNVE